MYIFGYKKRLKKLLCLPENKYYSVIELNKCASEKAELYISEYFKFKKIVDSTTDINEFIEYNDKIRDLLNKLIIFEEYVDFFEQTPSYVRDSYFLNEQIIIRCFLNRSCFVYAKKANKFKNITDRMKVYNEYYNLLIPYILKMDDDNLNYLKSFCKKTIIDKNSISKNTYCDNKDTQENFRKECINICENNSKNKNNIVLFDNTDFDEIQTPDFISKNKKNLTRKDKKTALKKANDEWDEIKIRTNIINNAKNGIEFFENYKIVKKLLEKLQQYEDFMIFTGGVTPTEYLEIINKNEQNEFREFLCRACDYYSEVAKMFDKELEREDVYNQFYNELASYINMFDDGNIYYINNYCKTKIIDINTISKNVSIDSTPVLEDTKKIEEKRRKIVTNKKKPKDIIDKNYDKKRSDNSQTAVSTAKKNIKKDRALLKNKVLLIDKFSKKFVYDNGINLSNKSISNFKCIEVDYSDNGFYIFRLQNLIIPKSSINTQINFIDNLITYANPEILKLVLFSEKSIYNEYNELPHLYLPLITKTDELKNSISIISTEI